MLTTIVPVLAFAANAENICGHRHTDDCYAVPDGHECSEEADCIPDQSAKTAVVTHSHNDEYYISDAKTDENALTCGVEETPKVTREASDTGAEPNSWICDAKALVCEHKDCTEGEPCVAKTKTSAVSESSASKSKTGKSNGKKTDDEIGNKQLGDLQRLKPNARDAGGKLGMDGPNRYLPEDAAIYYYDNPDLPAHLAEYVKYGVALGNKGGIIDLYYDDADFSAIYCTEVNNMSVDNASNLEDIQDQTAEGNMVGKGDLARYILARGQQKFDESWDSMELQMATQIAIWCVAEGVTSPNQLDAILYPVTATQSDKSHFAPTLEIGKYARALLEGARANATKPIDEIIPSFMSPAEASATTHTMKPDGNTFKIELDDTNGVLEYDWENYIKTVDADGLSISVTDNKMTITGNPGTAGKTIKLESTLHDGTIYYVKSPLRPGGSDKPVQKMVRFVGSAPKTTSLYIKVNGGTGTGDVAVSLTVSKTFADPSASRAVEFTVTNNNNPVDLSKLTHTNSGSGSFAWVTDGTDGKFTLTHDASVKFDGLAPGTYVVTESVPSDFKAPDVTVKGATGSKAITNGAEIVMNETDTTGSADFTNNKTDAPTPTVSLKVGKAFDDPSASRAVTFTITNNNTPVDLSKLPRTTSGSGSFAWVTDGADGKFTLTHNASVTFDGLAPGTYDITEDVPSGFDAPDVMINGAAGSKAITNGAEIIMTATNPAGSAAFTNKKTSTPEPTVSLTVSKTFADPNASRAVEFTVTNNNNPVDLSKVTKTDSGSGSFEWINDGKDGKFTLTHDASVKFDGLAPGTYDITESVPDGFKAPDVIVKGATGSKAITNGAEIIMTETDTAGSAAFTNNKTVAPVPTISLTVSKMFGDPNASRAVTFIVTNNNNPVDLSKLTKTSSGSGSFAWVTDGKDGKFTLTHDASVKFDGLAPGTYVVKESVPDGFDAPDVTIGGAAGSKAITNGAEIVMTANNPTGSAAFTNNKTVAPTPTVSLTVSKTFGDPNANRAVTFTVTNNNNPVDLSKLTKTTGGSGSFAWVTDGKDGKFTLTHDASVKFDGLAPGTYVVTESVPSGFDAPDVRVSGAAGSKAITNGAEVIMTVSDPTGSAAFTNNKIFAPIPEVPKFTPTTGAPSLTSTGSVRYTSVPKTGDASSIVPWAVLMAASTLLLGFVLWRRRKMRK
jgi:LPXTG-motif cell wall-anchored protein